MLDWTAAQHVAADPMTVPARKAEFIARRLINIARRLTNEVLSPRDARARWCSATALRDPSPILR
jgi:hypothetical protein